MPSLRCQFKNELKSRFKYNTSKHNASEEERKEYIFSKSTLENYIRHTEKFVKFLKGNGLKASKIDDARKYVSGFLEFEINSGKSNWTVKAEASALAKVYRCSITDFGVNIPQRKRKDIVRSRKKSNYSKHFSEVRNSPIVSFAKSTGLRREGMEHLKGTDITIVSEEEIIIHTKEKGGRERDVILFNSNRKVYDEARKIALKSAGKNEKVFPKISKAAPIHSYRSDYAKSLYKHCARDVSTLSSKEIYTCRKELSGLQFDKSAVRIVTEALGHSRLNVTVDNYLTH